jgi:hypothetical protein
LNTEVVAETDPPEKDAVLETKVFSETDTVLETEVISEIDPLKVKLSLKKKLSLEHTVHCP